MRSHQLSRETFSAIAAGGGGPTAISLLSDISYSKLLLLVTGVLRRATGRPGALDAERAFEQLASLHDKAPDEVEATLRHPSVRAWARHAARTLTRPSSARDADADLGRLGALAAAAAIRAGVPATVEVAAPAGVLVLPSLGRALLRRDRAVIDVSGDGAEIRCLPGGAPARVADDAAVDRLTLPADPRHDVPGWRALPRLSAGGASRRIELIIDDTDPYRMPAMPDLAGPLTDRQVREWQEVFPAGWEHLARHHPDTADEVRAALLVLTPLRSPEHGQVSATGRDTFGSVAMSVPTDPRSCAETLAHEVGHAKLTGLLDIVRLVLPDDGTRYYAPWRDDPRPAGGLLQGVYAYLGVTGFWRRERALDTTGTADREFARWRAAARAGAETLLNSGRLTAAGEEFVSGVRATLLGWERDEVPARAMARAADENQRHHDAWKRRNTTTAASG
ncbi:HEXXH motif domain-containing protein [Actinoallomurus oryzae]|uniref:HEXXH motif domain-containing protein n=1 Tax=Actinoallomurus oryzae TaxID=502180 RepID=A0ABP8R7B7_9ACTN